MNNPPFTQACPGLFGCQSCSTWRSKNNLLHLCSYYRWSLPHTAVGFFGGGGFFTTLLIFSRAKLSIPPGPAGWKLGRPRLSRARGRHAAPGRKMAPRPFRREDAAAGRREEIRRREVRRPRRRRRPLSVPGLMMMAELLDAVSETNPNKQK